MARIAQGIAAALEAFGRRGAQFTPEGKLRFLVEVAGADLDGFAPKDWEHLRSGLELFLKWTSDPKKEQVLVSANAWLDEGLDPRRFPADAFRTLQADVRHLLSAVADRGRGGPITIRGPLTFGLVSRREGEECRVLVEGGPVHDAVLLVALLLVNSVGVGKLRRCPEPQCGRLFLRVRKQRYCSPRCTNRANQREWRHTVNGRAREAAKKWGRYTRARQKALGRKVKVNGKRRVS